jgi:VIT1/CCC1 family predicted Fe2+/Mn2+ transporter
MIVTAAAPVRLETPLVLAAVIVSLAFISILGAHAGQVNVPRTLVRTLVIGVGTVAISYLVGMIAF